METTTAMQLAPYLTFPGTCEEALNFYREVLNGEIKRLQRAGDAPAPSSESDKDKVMHAEFSFGDGAAIYAADAFGEYPSPTPGSNYSLCVNLDISKIDEVFNKMAEGGKITMPLENTFWDARFGMITDRFNINWMFNAQIEAS